jgi:hypothetical protein
MNFPYIAYSKQFMNNTHTNNIPKIAFLCERYKVKKLYALGLVLTDKFNNQNDIDSKAVRNETAAFVLKGKPVQKELPTEIRQRNSL